MDTRYWGPSAWQLFHWVAFRAKEPRAFLRGIQDSLPCKFCRQSTTEYVKAHPLGGDPGKWLFDIHNTVNRKLRTQCRDDPNVVDPGEDPAFDDVRRKYESMELKNVLGRDFLFSVAANYPDEPSEADKETQQAFLDRLEKVYPADVGRLHADLGSRKEYMAWMYGFLKRVAQKSGARMPSYRGYVHRTMYYKSGCAKKTYRGKTCRRAAGGGGRTKVRDNTRTHRIAVGALL